MMKVMDVDFRFEMGAAPPENDVRFEEFWTSYSQEMVSKRPAKSVKHKAFRDSIFEANQAGFEAMELLHETAAEAINWASETVHNTLEGTPEDDAFAEYINVQVGISARALLAFDEVAWLLRGGYPRGAWTRVRSIQEQFVVAVTLGLYGSPGAEHPELVERYLNHHRVFAPSIANELVATESEGIDRTLNSEVLENLNRRRQELLEAYGKGFERPWGWAAPLFQGKARPSFLGLNNLILPTSTAFYGIASTHVHASSQGFVEAGRETENGERSFLAGPQKDGLAVPAALASIFLVTTLGAVIPASIRYPDDTEANTDGHFMLGALLRIHEQIVDGMTSTDEYSTLFSMK